MDRIEPDRPPDPDRTILGIRNGDVAAFEVIFRAHYGGLCSFVRPRVGSAAAAEEVVQEVFLRLWRGRARLDPRQSLRGYLYPRRGTPP